MCIIFPDLVQFFIDTLKQRLHTRLFTLVALFCFMFSVNSGINVEGGAQSQSSKVTLKSR